MRLPAGCGKDSLKIVKLNHALYGLKQASNSWNNRFKQFLFKHKFVQSNADPCVFYTYRDGFPIILTIYVDDSNLIGKRRYIDEIKTDLNNEFEMTDLGPIKSMLGINIIRTNDTLSLDQAAYTQAIIKRFKMEDAKPSPTPIEINMKNKPISPSLDDNNQYRQLIGCLNFLTRCTRPDIAYAVNYCAQSVEKPTENDWSNAKRILRYLKEQLISN